MTKQATINQSARISARIDINLKRQTESILEDLGLTPTEAIIMYYKQILLQRGIPFDVSLPKETILAIKDIEGGKNLTKYNNKKEMYKDLGLPC